MKCSLPEDGLDLSTTVGQWVARHPSTSRVFESLSIDYCCGGNVSLEQACAKHKIDPADVLMRLQAASERGAHSAGPNWLDAPLAELCDHIEVTHHAYLKAELPRLTDIVAKVARVHGDAHPELRSVQQALAELRAELEPHMFKEEQILFPAIRWLENSLSQPAFPYGTIANPIRMMEHENDGAGNCLRQIRELTRDYEVPAGACNTYRAMLDGLQTLEEDMHVHVHKENSILFPRAIRAEARLAEGQANTASTGMQGVGR
jgi:regulator of cell morphogenesis and NO signaling